MMRYQGLSPGNLPLSNGRRSHWRTCKEEDGLIGTRELDEDSSRTIPNFADGHKGVPRFRAPSSKPPQDNNFSTFSGDSPPQNKDNHHHNEVNHNNSQVQNGDVLLQWGHRKRSRLSRSSENKATGTAGSMMMTTTDDSSSSSSPQIQAMINVKRRSVSLPTQTVASVQETKNAANTNIMNPPVAITAVTNVVTSKSNGKGGNFKSCSKDTSTVFGNRRNSEERSAVGSGSHPPPNVRAAAAAAAPAAMVGGGGAAGAAAASSSRSTKLGKRSPSKVVEKQHDHKRSITTSTSTNTTTIDTGTTTTITCSLRVGDDKLNGSMQQSGGALGISHQRQQHNKHNNNNNSIASGSLQEAAGCSTNTNVTNHHRHDENVKAKNETATAVAANGEVNEWPRVYIPLTRKEKEEDFLLMKGTKLPHRPKKRPKAVDRMLQYCFPGMWLSDVTKARYEVKEKKSTTKKPKRRGLKGMDNMDSDSE